MGWGGVQWRGEVAAAGTPEELAYGENEVARTFIAASGVHPAELGRLARK